MQDAYELDGGGTVSLYTRQRDHWSREDLYKVANPGNCVCERETANGQAFFRGG